MTTQEILQGVHDWTNGKIVYDISVAHPDGQGNPTKYANLTAALGTGGANIPEALRKGGMSIKFVLSSDNKYVQYMLKEQTWTVDVRCWEKVNLEKEVNVLNEQINKINITSASAGVTPYLFKAGTTYHIKNNDNVVTISHRDSPDGESEDIVSIATYGEIDYTPTTDGLYLRYGAACNLDIYIKSSVYDYGKHAYDKVENADTNPIINSEELITSGAVFESTQLHSSIAKYAIQGEGFVDGLYWYVDNGKIAVITNSNTIAGCFEKIPVSEGDEVRFHREPATNYNLIVTDALGNVLDSYPSAAYARLEGKYTVPEGAAYLYINTLKTNKDKSFCFVNVQIIPEIEKRLDIEEECLMLPYAPIAQKDKYYDVNGVLQSRSGLKAFEISNLEGIYKIRCIVTFSSYGYYGFVVNNTFIPQQWVPAEHAGENYGYVTMRVPEGATKFLCSWASAFVTHNDVSLMQKLENTVAPAINLADSINVSYNIKNDWVVGRYNMSNGEVDASNTAFKAVEISLSNFYVKTLTFKKTYTGDSTYACYGFVVNGKWQGYAGIAATAEPYEATVDVPSGATVFKVCWNMNQATSSDLVVNAVGYKFSNEPKPNQPIYQFEPDFNLSRIPQMTCPSETAIHAITLAELYAMYDALMAAYPNYITKVDCDAEVQAALEITAPSYMEGCPIYMYKFIPKMGGNSIDAEYSIRPKVLITSMHPQERLGVYATYEMMKMICENWANDVNAEQMRSLIDIYVLPAPWSWNFANNSRVNYNGINPNRQFPTKRWKESGQGTTNWSGTAPLSEYEAKVINYYLLQIKPNACLDVHTSGNDDVGHMGVLLTTTEDQVLIDLCSVIARTTSNRVIQDNSNFPSDPNTCIYGVYAEGVGPESGYFWEYAYEQGCKYATLSEESPYSKWNNGVFGSTIVEQYTDGILREQVQYIFNTILRLTKAACVQFYKG